MVWGRKPAAEATAGAQQAQKNKGCQNNPNNPDCLQQKGVRMQMCSSLGRGKNVMFKMGFCKRE